MADQNPFYTGGFIAGIGFLLLLIGLYSTNLDPQIATNVTNIGLIVVVIGALVAAFPFLKEAEQL